MTASPVIASEKDLIIMTAAGTDRIDGHMPVSQVRLLVGAMLVVGGAGGYLLRGGCWRTPVSAHGRLC